MEQVKIPEPLPLHKPVKDLGWASVGVFAVGWCLSQVQSLTAVSFPSPSKMKRAGTTGSSRGMALYEEEVRILGGR